MLELAILGLLKEHDLHGYELKKRLAELLGPLSGASWGSLYPALRRLEAAGAVKAVEAARVPEPRPKAAFPMTGSLGGELAAFRSRARLRTSAGPREPAAAGRTKKKVYGITDRGEALFEELLTAESGPGDDDRTFNLKLAFARYLHPDARLGLLERRRAHLVERLARTRAPGRTKFDTYTRSLWEHRTATTEADISWLDTLIAAERQEDNK